MMIYPTLELLNGRCVSLSRGRLDEAAVWHVDPVETARSWAAAGAEWMHLTDFDWIEGREGKIDLVRDIIRSAGIPVQLAGGFRTAESVAQWIDQGAGRIVLSTLAVLDPQCTKALARSFPDQIVLSVDVYKGKVMTHGWREESSYTPEQFIKAFNDAPFAGVVITDVESDTCHTDAQLGLISGLAAQSRAPVIASGVVRNVDDVARLKYAPNIDGALIGRALFQKSVDLAAALLVARPERSPTAEFI